MIETSRRNFIIGATASLVVAPAIVRAASIMPVKAIENINMELFLKRWGDDLIGHFADSFQYMITYEKEFKIKQILDYEFYKGEQW